MISIEKHIEILLLDHDCVVIPDFGGFITCYVESSTVNEQEDLNVFTPPCRTIRFNPSLRTNDGVLIQSYMRAYDINFIAAEKQMKLDVASLRQEIELQGFYEFTGVGIIRCDIYGNLSFESATNKLLSPELYGLPTLDIKPYKVVAQETAIKQELRQKAISPIVSETLVKTDETVQALSAQIQSKTKLSRIHIISNRLVDLSVSVAAAILLFLLVSYPAMTHTDDTRIKVAGTIAYLSDKEANDKKDKDKTDSFDSIPHKRISQNEQVSLKKQLLSKEQDVSETDSQTVEHEKYLSQKNLNELGKITSTKQNSNDSYTEKFIGSQVKSVDKKEYSIVLASYVSKVNAEDYINKLSKSGFKGARYVKINSVSRILYSQYPTKESAQSALRDLKNQNEAFSDAWIIQQ